MKYFLTLCTLLFLLLGGCGGKTADGTTKTVSEAISVYEGDSPVLAYTLNETGELFAVTLPEGENCYQLLLYGTEHDLKYQYTFDASIQGIQSIAANGQTVYFTAAMKEGQGVTLYAFHTDTQELKALTDYTFFDTARQIIFKDGRLYLLGSRDYSVSAKSPTGNKGFSFYEDKVIYYLLETGDSYAISIDNPIKMAFSDNGKLMIHAYLDEDGYAMLEYDPAQDSLKTVAKFDSYHILDFASCHDGRDLIYTYGYNPRGVVLSALDDLSGEMELCPYDLIQNSYNTKMLYTNGELYLLDKNANVMHFTLEDVYHESKPIRYISPGYAVDEPYGCGYMMERQELEEDKFVLKVLAQDTDYDLCLIDSFHSGSYNLRKNGVFYPLNDVPGMEEYLEKCFPYVKAAATKEDGTIWMLPIAVYMPGLIVQEETLNELGIPLHRNMTWPEFASALSEIPQDAAELKSLSRMVCSILFFQQYFNCYASVDNEVFRTNAAALQQLDSDMWLTNYREDKRYLFYYVRYMYDYTNEFIRRLYYGEDARVYPMPRLNADDANTATCIFLAVNPASDRLQETLSFLQAYVAWQMAQEDAPLYFKEPIPPEDTFEADVYALYQNGEIAFTVDEDTYSEGYEKMLDGELDLEAYIRDTERKLKIYFGE